MNRQNSNKQSGYQHTDHPQTGHQQTSHFPIAVMMRLAWRNLWRHRKRTLITLSSIAVGFGLAVLSIGLGDGSHNSMVRNAIKLGEGHITIQPRHYIEAPANHKYLVNGQQLATTLEELTIAGRYEPRISLQVLASTANNSTGAVLEGMNPTTDQRVAMLRPRLIEGRWLDPEDQRGIIIGTGMARKLKVRIGSKVVLMAGTQSGDSQAQLGRVRGIFSAKMEEVDNFLIISDIEFSRYFLSGEGADTERQPVTRFAIFLDDPDRTELWQAKLNAVIDSDQVAVLSWQQMMPQLVQFIVIDDAGNYIFLLLILIMVIFGIVNTVLMSVLERTREFGLLRALGLSRHHLLLLVICESILLSLLALIAGWLVGGGAHLWFSLNGIDFSALMGEGKGTAIMGTFMDPVVFTELSWHRVLQLSIIIFSATLCSGIYPAIKAARITPVEALRT